MLTKEKFVELRAKGLSVEQIIKFEKQKKSGFNYPGKETLGDIKQTGSALRNIFTDTSNRIVEAKNSYQSGEQGLLRTLGQQAGATAGGLSKALGEVIIGTGKTLLPQSVEQGIKTGLTSSIEAITPIASSIDRQLGRPVGKWLEQYKTLDPKTKRDVDALFGIGSLALDAAGISASKKAGEKVVKTGIDYGKKTIKGAENLAGKGLSTTGAIIEKTGKRAVSTLFPPSEAQALKLTSYKAKTPLGQRISNAAKGIEKAPVTPADVAVKYNLVGLSRTEIAAKAKRVSKTLWKDVVNPAFK